MKNSKEILLEASIKKEASGLNIKSVLIGLSGGPDSIAVAFLLNRIGLKILALHCNFHLRGEESNRDSLFVSKFCQSHQIPLKIIDFDVEDYLIKNKGVSVEMACRNLRHEWFRDNLDETGYDRIVTGHNADDNIETFFLNVLRGSGSKGLKGMVKDNGKIWRPLLDFHRQQILEYLHGNSLDYVVDSSNLRSDYRRNYLRNEIIPLLRHTWKGFDKALDKTIRNLQTENLLVESLLLETLPSIDKPLAVETIQRFPAPLLLIKRYIDPLSPFVSTPEEILSAIEAKKPHIRRWRLPLGMVWLRNGNLFIEMCHSKRHS